MYRWEQDSRIYIYHSAVSEISLFLIYNTKEVTLHSLVQQTTTDCSVRKMYQIQSEVLRLGNKSAGLSRRRTRRLAKHPVDYIDTLIHDCSLKKLIGNTRRTHCTVTDRDLSSNKICILVVNPFVLPDMFGDIWFFLKGSVFINYCRFTARMWYKGRDTVKQKVRLYCTIFYHYYYE